MPLDLPPQLYVPDRPAIILPADRSLLRPTLADRIALGMLPGMVPAVAGVAPPVSLAYVSSNSSTSNASSYNFGNFNAPTAGLMIVATGCGVGGGGGVISSISIGGTNGSIHVSDDGASGHAVAIASRVVGSGNQNVTVNWTAGGFNAGCAVWLLTGYLSATPNDTDSDQVTTNAHSLALDVSAGGCAIYFNMHGNTNSTTWTDATERSDDSAESRFTGADYTSVTAAPGHSAQASWTTSTGSSIIGAAWR